MAISAYDVQIFLWKILKLSSETCVALALKYPFVSFSLLCLLLLYIVFPPVLWFLIYSFPLVVCSAIAIRVTSRRGNDKTNNEEERREHDEKCSNKNIIKSAAVDHDTESKDKPFKRVHSVRRRRAMNLAREDDKHRDNNDNNGNNVEDKNAVSSTNFNHDMVDKNALIEESPKEIHEVEVQESSVVDHSAKDSYSCVASSSRESTRRDKFIFKAWKDEEKEEEAAAALDLEQKDLGISEIERNKRLENLIARRRTRKLLNLQVRRTLMKMDHNDHRISNLVIPKLHSNILYANCNSSTAYCGSSQFSPGPGSAPSVLIPMRNPFDLPYDPQEEKPDLSGDSFNQEFKTPSSQHKDLNMMFCRHESFSLGPFSPDRELKHDLEDSQGYEFTKTGDQFDREMNQMTQPEPSKMPDPESTIDGQHHDQIKEIIQVYDQNGNQSHAQEKTDQPWKCKSASERDPSRNPSSSSCSSEEDQPFSKIDREAILKSLSSLARRNVKESGNDGESIEDYLNRPTSLFMTNKRSDDRFYYADKIRQRHTPSYSIASDLQVEVSDVSSPPLTIDENLSYKDDDASTNDGDMERNTTLSNGEDHVWMGAPYLSQVDENESMSRGVSEISEQDVIQVGFSRIKKSEPNARVEQESTSSSSLLTPSNQSPDSINHDRVGRASDNNPDSSQAISNEHVVSPILENVQQSTKNVSIGPSHGNSSGTPMENKIDQLEQFETTEPPDTLPQCHPTEHSTRAENIRPPENSEEGQGSMAQRETIFTVSTPDVIESPRNPGPSDNSVRFRRLPAEVSIAQPNLDQIINVQMSAMSPKSVLLPTFSVSSFDQDMDQEVHRLERTRSAEDLSPVSTQNSVSLPDHSPTIPYSAGDVETLQQESSSSQLPRTSTDLVATSLDIESTSNSKVHFENSEKHEEVAVGNSQETISHDKLPEPSNPMEEASSRSLNNSRDPTTFSKHVAHEYDSNSSQYTEQKVSSSFEHPRMFNTLEAATQDIESTRKLKFHENEIKSKEVADGNLQMSGSFDKHADSSNQTEKTSSRSFELDDPIAFSKQLDVDNGSNSTLSAKEVLSYFESPQISTTLKAAGQDNESPSKLNVHENGEKIEEVPVGGSQMSGAPGECVQTSNPTEGTSSSTFSNCEDPVAYSKHVEHDNGSNSSVSTAQVSSSFEHPRMSVTLEVTGQDTESASPPKLHENVVKPKEALAVSTQIPGSPEKRAEPSNKVGQTSSRSVNNNEDPIALTKHTGYDSGSNSSHAEEEPQHSTKRLVEENKGTENLDETVHNNINRHDSKIKAKGVEDESRSS